MNVVALREKLHTYIDTADEQHLSAIFTLVENDLPVEDMMYDEKIMDMLQQRREAHRSGVSKSYTIDESMSLIRNHQK